MNNIIQIKHKSLIETLIAMPDEGCSIRNLANLSGVSYSTTWRAIKSIEKSGAVRLRKVGTVCLVLPQRRGAAWDALTNIDPLMASLKKDFGFISRDASGILLYGSHAKGIADERSDIDICIVKPRNCKLLGRIISKLGDRYDIKIFEEMPLFLKMDVIESYKVIFGSEPDVSYYFYGYRKLMQDMRGRIMANRFPSIREMVRARKRWLHARK